MRVVIDTNLIVSATFFNGLPRKLFEAAVRKRFDFVTSPEILQEYQDVLDRMSSRSRNTDAAFLAQGTISLIVEHSIIIQPSHHRKLCRDTDDDKFINCALSAHAMYIVSGDSDLLELKVVDEIRILTARNFMDILGSI